MGEFHISEKQQKIRADPIFSRCPDAEVAFLKLTKIIKPKHLLFYTNTRSNWSPKYSTSPRTTMNYLPISILNYRNTIH